MPRILKEEYRQLEYQQPVPKSKNKTTKTRYSKI